MNICYLFEKKYMLFGQHFFFPRSILNINTWILKQLRWRLVDYLRYLTNNIFIIFECVFYQKPLKRFYVYLDITVIKKFISCNFLRFSSEIIIYEYIYFLMWCNTLGVIQTLVLKPLYLREVTGFGS